MTPNASMGCDAKEDPTPAGLSSQREGCSKMGENLPTPNSMGRIASIGIRKARRPKAAHEGNISEVLTRLNYEYHSSMPSAWRTQPHEGGAVQ